MVEEVVQSENDDTVIFQNNDTTTYGTSHIKTVLSDAEFQQLLDTVSEEEDVMKLSTIPSNRAMLKTAQLSSADRLFESMYKPKITSIFIQDSKMIKKTNPEMLPSNV